MSGAAHPVQKREQDVTEGEEHEQHADAGDDAELDTLEFPEAARRLVQGGHVHMRAARVWLRANARM